MTVDMHTSHGRARIPLSHTTTCGAASLFMRRSANDVPGDAEKQSGALGSPLLLCLP